MRKQNYEEIVRQKLKTLREIKNLKQSDIAAILEVGTSTYNQYENGKRKLTINQLCKIADEYDLPIDWFTGRDTETNKRLKQ